MCAETMADPRPHSILIVDDDSVSREVMAMTLEMHGYAVSSAEDGDAAVVVLNEAKQAQHASFSDPILPDLVLMDTQMPGLSGVELIAALRAAGAERVVAISASEPGEAIRGAADGFLLKPVGPDAVAALFSAAVVLSASAEIRDELTEDLDPQANFEASPQIDLKIVAKFRAMMPASSVREIYEATATDMRMRLDALENAVEAGDVREVSRIAHSIKGACAMVGMIAGRNAAATLETSDLPGTWAEEVMQLHIALEALKVMLASDFPA